MKNLDWSGSPHPCQRKLRRPDHTRLYRVVYVKKLVLQGELRRHMLSQGLHSKTFGCVMAGSDEVNAFFSGCVHSLLGRLPRHKHICANLDGPVDILLRCTGTPG